MAERELPLALIHDKTARKSKMMENGAATIQFLQRKRSKDVSLRH
jgi:hypothetical protein